ncbi:archaetidylserine decarboxylase [Filibacter tadaridae]|uniref:phosphatidylserine decarboxylase n=1 Tax=Filibacter tadaridae TaxID=2483811 RepID=A0A3P5WVX0_9BACL|nr:archaetidylserine decarboxylase [Filibacter tadaridae]VDC22646.1 Phosphatidylserine decarboxylase proenzyme [Filibacter tadaridae]
MKKILFNSFVELTGNPLSSKFLELFTQSRMSRPLIRPFSKMYHIDESEMAQPIEHYKSLQAFFTRNLKEDSRSIDESSNTLISPVDGIVSGIGKISKDQTFIIKNRSYNIRKLFGDEKKAAPYKEGFYFLLYLSPSHYHHFHYPANGKLISRYALGGISYPVNDLGLRFKEDLFSTNHRLISELATPYGRVAIVKVGALNVNSIQIHSSSPDCIKGAEFGHFSFGSTVILFIENSTQFKATLPVMTNVKMGQPIGEWPT